MKITKKTASVTCVKYMTAIKIANRAVNFSFDMSTFLSRKTAIIKRIREIVTGTYHKPKIP